MAEQIESTDEVLVRAIEKGLGSRIHVRLSRFRERDYLDIRNFYETDDGEWKPTRKGIAIPVGESKSVDVLFEGGQIAPQAGQIMADFAGYGTHAYRVGR